MIKSELFALLLVVCAFARPAQAADQLPVEAFVSRSTGSIELTSQQHAPIYAEVERSSTLTLRLAEALAAKGFSITQDRSAAKAVLTFRGDIALQGGPSFNKGVKVAIGDAVETSLLDAKNSGSPTRADVVQTVAALAINERGLAGAITPFWRGLYLSNMASAIGDITGLRAGFNKALTGDPRGICLSRCDDWNKVNQTAYLRVTLQAGAEKNEIRVLTRLVSESVAPEQVVDRAFSDAISALRFVDLPSETAR